MSASGVFTSTLGHMFCSHMVAIINETLINFAPICDVCSASKSNNSPQTEGSGRAVAQDPGEDTRCKVVYRTHSQILLFERTKFPVHSSSPTGILLLVYLKTTTELFYPVEIIVVWWTFWLTQLSRKAHTEIQTQHTLKFEMIALVTLGRFITTKKLLLQSIQMYLCLPSLVPFLQIWVELHFGHCITNPVFSSYYITPIFLNLRNKLHCLVEKVWTTFTKAWSCMQFSIFT